MKNKKKTKAFYFMAFLIIMAGACKDSFIQPEPKSFHTPSNTLTNRRGFEAILLHNRKLLAEQYVTGVFNPIMLDYYYSDLGVDGELGVQRGHNWIQQVVPTMSSRWFGHGIKYHWSVSYEAINNANIVLSNLDTKNVSWESNKEEKIVKAEAYFHRSLWYYRLLNWFGDVPLVVKVVKKAKLDFYTYSREAILNKIRKDMEFAVQWLPEVVAPGKENRAAGYYLLTKIYLELREFEDAVNAASQVIDGNRYALMTDRFGSGRYADDPRFNVLWDLHQKENISGGVNTESILAAQSQIATEGNIGPSQWIYNVQPAYWEQALKDPNGEKGTVDGPSGNPFSDSLGRGDGLFRPTPYYEYALWQDEPNDLRHSDVNWWSKDEFIYNNPASEYYGQPFDEETMVNDVGIDTIQVWYEFPFNKIHVYDETREHRKQGGYTDWYIYRLAGLYLLRAEAHYWIGQMGKAADDINKVRERAHASPISAGDVSIDYIFDERARELFMESPRDVELTRVSYIMAQLRQNGYSLDDMSKKNWFYDRIIRTNVFYREEISGFGGTYKARPYHIYWPIPQDEIDANQFGHINQNEGYSGAEDNIEPRDLSDLGENSENK